jgi:type II secretory pathway pseudopilin PulG
MKSNRKGITIIEVVVSIVIVGFVLVGMLQLYSVGAIQSNIARHKAMAANIAQLEIESLVSATYEGITFSDYPVTKAVKIDTGRTNNASDDINGIVVIGLANVSEGYKVTATVSWNDYYGAVSEVMTSTITSYL